eukprot:Protomagalhaensia_wolfi_Nauph_80__4223@NODE_42_length_4330_cov_209_921697_g34_i0_p1_GENE_NODE_42_length_4330_cov_209_921697_g34_i0NODE_42_length_4330_cov_209_921697_g34_i0_p1_ORF_typecomplete_len305_score8_99Peptidase_C13/PF01650_18/1e51Peptidase_C14/PF00656_22/0_00024_NODE_42_length_4330_cov_209_921697_g34_i031194033
MTSLAFWAAWALFLFQCALAFSTAEFDEFVKELIRPDGGLESTVLAPTELPDDLHVVITDTSTYFHNYRHVTNAFIIYRIVKWLGVPDSKIHLIVGECSACDPRNIDHGRLYFEPGRLTDIYDTSGQVEVDLRGANVHSVSWMTLMSGRKERYTPWSNILKSNEHSNVFVYLSGHGGNQFTKFQDFDELSSDEIAEAFLELKVKRKYRELFFLVDSCEALTLGDEILAPNTLVLGSSKIGENAYSCNDDSVIGLSLMDRFTYKTALLFQSLKLSNATSMSISDYVEGMDISKSSSPFFQLVMHL